MKKQLTCIDLFCGAGGFSCGMIQAGWHVVAAMDASRECIWTYYHNLCDEDTKLIGDFSRKDMENLESSRKEWRMYDSGYRSATIAYQNRRYIFRDMLPDTEDDIPLPPAVNALFYKKAQEVTGYEILDAVEDVTNGEQIGVVVGGPPCQGFSRSNHNRHAGDTRNFLVFEFGRLIMEINPMTFVMENVPDIQKFKLPDGRNLIKVFMEMVNKRDWDTYYEVQALYLDGDMDPEGECTIAPQERKPEQRTLEGTWQQTLITATE